MQKNVCVQQWKWDKFSNRKSSPNPSSKSRRSENVAVNASAARRRTIAVNVRLVAMINRIRSASSDVVRSWRRRRWERRQAGHIFFLLFEEYNVIIQFDLIVFLRPLCNFESLSLSSLINFLERSQPALLCAFKSYTRRCVTWWRREKKIVKI